MVRGDTEDTYFPLFRPVLPVKVIGQFGEDKIAGRVDTGADETLLPEHLIELLGIEELTGHVVIRGIGLGTTVRFGTVDMEVGSGAGQPYRWRARVGFYPGFEPLFGITGFLEHFEATFNGPGRFLDLIPAGRAPRKDRRRRGRDGS
jgi:hypothetical protein